MFSFPDQRDEVPKPQGISHVHDHKKHTHDDGADGKKFTEDDHFLEGLPIVDIGGNDQHDGGCGDTYQKSEVPDVKGPEIPSRMLVTSKPV